MPSPCGDLEVPCALPIARSLPSPCARRCPPARSSRRSRRQRAPTMPIPRLWVVKDADTTIYLFGTIHVLKPGLTLVRRGGEDRVRSRRDELVLEMVEPRPGEMQALVMATGVSPATGPTLTEQLPADKRAGLCQGGDRARRCPATAFDRFEPWLAATNLSLAAADEAGLRPGERAGSGADRRGEGGGQAGDRAGDRRAADRLFRRRCRETAQIAFLDSDDRRTAQGRRRRWRRWSTTGRKGDPDALGAS